MKARRTTKLATELRALALVGLAGTLLSIAYLYGRFVFKRSGAAKAAGGDVAEGVGTREDVNTKI